MDLRLSDLRPNLWQVAVLGAVFAMFGGAAVGGYFKAGYSLDTPAAGDSRINVGEAMPEPIQYMTDASGRVPDYVIGTDYTASPEPEPVFIAEAPDLASAGAVEAEVQPASYAEPAAPPSLTGDILAGLRPTPANENGADRGEQSTPAVLDNPTSPVVRTGPSEAMAVAAAY